MPTKKRSAKPEQFKVMGESAAAQNWYRYLALQVELFARSEFELFARHGLSKKHSPILDLGCGPGLYSRALRAWSPSTRIVAVDTNKALLDRFRATLGKHPDPKIEIVHWSAGGTTPPASLKRCKAAIMRYVLQHTHDPVQVVTSVASALPKGALLFIIEEDDGLYQFEPDFPAFRQLIEIWRCWAEMYGGDRQIGRKVPGIVTRAGLKVQNVELLCHTPQQTGLKDFLHYFMLSFGIVCETAPEILSAAAAAKLERSFNAYLDNAGPGNFLFYPQVITVAKVV